MSDQIPPPPGPPPPPPGRPPGGWAPPPPPPFPAAGDAAGQPAKWWQRLVAILIDGLVISVPLTIFFVISGIGNFSATGGEVVADAGGLGVLISFLAPLAYSAVLEGGPRGQSVGKMALGIRVVDAQSGGPIGPGRAALRRLVYEALFYACVVPGLVNGLSPLWTARGQAWHDKVGGSVVVRVPRQVPR